MPFARDMNLNPKGITIRIAVLAWLLTLLTMSLFVFTVVPQQKRDLQNALESKALGVASSLRDVTRSAALSEDFSGLVEHSLQVLDGDKNIEYLVITRNDGFSVIVGRDGWRNEELNHYWRPKTRRRIAGLEVVPLFNHRVFRFSEPFDTSTIPWGWIHVGLSSRDYDRSVIEIYRRTGILVFICVGISLLISVQQAKRIVRPMVTLESVVRRIAIGDLEARAEITTEDEIASLARSFNSMAESIAQQNRILESVRFAAQQFLVTDDWQSVVAGVLEKVGSAADASRAFVITSSPAVSIEDQANFHAEWLRNGWNDGITEADRFAFNRLMLRECKDRFISGETLVLSAGELSCLKNAGRPMASRSSVVIPLKIHGEWAGVLGFDDFEAGRQWSDAERDSFRAVADMLGVSCARQHAQQALLEANENLEVRVADRTRELQDQVHAKERARTELADAQIRLIELSRESGMAEIATGVLHNVGNVLNSVNVSATLVATKVRESRVDNFISIVSMLQQNRDRLSHFLDHDPKGSRVLPYLEKLAQHFKQERTFLAQEVEHLTSHVGHIKTIVATQQSYAKVSGLVEKLDLPALVRDVIHMIQTSCERHQISLEQDFEQVPVLLADKHKVVQILMNLLRNAKDAVKQSPNSQRTIRIRIYQHREDCVRVQVQDSGVGLSPENLTRIFAHGFTTKANGHGFGLHSGALAAREMGGSLFVESEGLGYGATFTLELPVKSEPNQETESSCARVC